MPTRYSIADARAHLSEIVGEAEAGRTVELTRRGKPVVVVISLDELQRMRAGRTNFADAYQRFASAHPLDEAASDSAYFTGLRDRSTGRKVGR